MRAVERAIRLTCCSAEVKATPITLATKFLAVRHMLLSFLSVIEIYINQFFMFVHQALITANCDRYFNAVANDDKLRIVRDIIHEVQLHGGRFVKRACNGWIEVSPEEARQKVTHAIQYKIRCKMKRIQKVSDQQTISNQRQLPFDHVRMVPPPPPLHRQEHIVPHFEALPVQPESPRHKLAVTRVKCDDHSGQEQIEPLPCEFNVSKNFSFQNLYDFEDSCDGFDRLLEDGISFSGKESTV
jgi:hypothetical protein